MRRSTVLFLLTIAVGVMLVANSPDGYADEPDKTQMDQPVAKIGDDIVITVGDLEEKVNSIPSYARKNFLTVEGKKKILENMIKGELLYLAAKEANFDEDPEIKQKLEDTRKRIFQSEYFKREIKDAVLVDMDRIKAYYEEHKDEFMSEPTAKVRHILCDSEKECKKLKKKIEKGKISFIDAAKAYSRDIPSAKVGGFLGYITKDAPVRGIGRAPEFVQAAFSLNDGQISDPVKTDKGWHIILAEEVNPAQPKPLDEVKNTINDILLVTDEEIEAEWNNNRSEYMTKERMKVKHILVSDKKTADEVIKKLNDGADFDKLAEEYSEDTVTRSRGGDLGFIYHEGAIRGIGDSPEFKEAAFALTPGQYTTTPLQTSKGYHVIMCVSYEPARQKSLNEVKTLIRNKLLREKREQALERAFDKLKERYGVEANYDLLTDTSDTLEVLPQIPDSGPSDLPAFPFPGTE